MASLSRWNHADVSCMIHDRFKGREAKSHMYAMNIYIKLTFISKKQQHLLGGERSSLLSIRTQILKNWTDYIIHLQSTPDTWVELLAICLQRWKEWFHKRKKVRANMLWAVRYASLMGWIFFSCPWTTPTWQLPVVQPMYDTRNNQRWKQQWMAAAA